MSKRLATLEKLTAAGDADSFTWYALALEYRSLGRVDDAMRAFSTLRRQDPDYIPAYQMAGTMLAAEGRDEEAIEWLREGVARAKAKGEEHPAAEMTGILETLTD